ncbi:MAG: MFS transporter [Deltaproteobacteria bacterium]|nr:MFS transporter [Deltaproteobacteria bacterium]
MSTAANGPPRLGIWRKLAYALGQGGNVLTYQLISTFVLTLYLPTAGKGEPLMPEFLLAVGSFAGIGTYIVLNVLSRGIDTFYDPWIANVSDRSKSRFGRRRLFMAVSVLPLAAVTGLVFLPPSPTSSMLNVAWLGVMLTAYYCLFSAYVAPYLALLPELVPDKKENTVVSTLQAAAALLGGLIATVVAPLAFLGDADTDRGPLKTMALVLAGVSFLMMVVPVLAIDERRLVAQREGEAKSHKPFLESLKATFAFRPFVPYVFGNNLFFFGFTIIQTGVPFYVEVLLQRPLSDVALVIGPLFGVAALAFPVVAVLANRLGKRNVMVGAAVMLAAMMGVGVPLLPTMPSLALPLFALAGIPIACFLALPNAMLADICDADARRTGERREAMFFGAQGFQQKIALGIAAGLFQWVASSFGRTVDAPLGVQLSGPLAAVALIASALCFWRYRERDVQQG